MESRRPYAPLPDLEEGPTDDDFEGLPADAELDFSIGTRDLYGDEEDDDLFDDDSEFEDEDSDLY